MSLTPFLEMLAAIGICAGFPFSAVGMLWLIIERLTGTSLDPAHDPGKKWAGRTFLSGLVLMAVGLVACNLLVRRMRD